MINQYSKLYSSLLLISLLNFANIADSSAAQQETGTKKNKQQSGMLEKIAQKNLGRDIAFRFHPYMFGITGIRLDNFRIAENEKYLKEHPYLSPWAVSSESVDIRYNPLALLIGRISISKIEITNPQVQVAIDSHARSNFEDLAEQQKKNRFSNWIRAHYLKIENMNVDIYSELMFAQPIKYEVSDIDVDIRNVIKGKIATVKVVAKTPDAITQNVDISGTIGPIVSIARMEESPMTIQYNVHDAPLAFELAKIPDSVMQDKRYRRTIALPESGLANVGIKLNGDVWSGIDVDGNIDLSNIVLASIDKEVKGIPFDVNVGLSTQVSLDKQTTEVENISIKLNDALISIKGKINNIIDNPQADLVLSSEDIDLEKLNRIYPFFSEINKIKIIHGATELDLKAGGNLKNGLTLKGALALKELQLSNLKETQKGKALNASISLNKDFSFSTNKNQVNFEDIQLDIANSLIQISGTVDNATQIARTLRAKIYSQAVDIKAIHEFFPFYDRFLPTSLSYDGYFSFAAIADADMRKAKVKGSANLSDLTFTLENFARKKQKSKFDVIYEAGYDDNDEIYAKADFDFDKGELDNAQVYSTAIEHILGGPTMTPEARAYFNQLDKNNIRFASASGHLNYKGGDKADIEMKISNITNSIQEDAQLNIKGTIDINDFSLDINGQLILSKSSYKTILALNPSAKRYLVNTGKGSTRILSLPLKVKGSVTNPSFKVASK